VNPERWLQIEGIFHGALEREPHERVSFLDRSCGDDSWLRGKVEALLRSHDVAGSFLKSPASPGEFPPVRTSASAAFVGQHLGSYELTEHLGSGGMGDVYRARDTQLKRSVAIKVLPQEFSRDPDRVARFQREAIALAALNHPNIAAIHDLDEIDGTRFLVLEFVEGETLAARLKRGPLPTRQSLEVCRQVAEGLEGAHARGVQHRDLKPDNIQITPDGRVKLLDFGLAKVLADENEGKEPTGFPNLTQWNTKPGMILGTAHYLSPEQARGQQPDKRTDIWAFGCVLFEALTGKQVFPGETIMDVVVSILKSEPNWELLPPDVPSSVQSLLRRCLQKEAAHRLSDIAHARMTLEDVLADAPPKTRKKSPSWAVVAAVAVIAAVLAGVLAWNYRPSVPATASTAGLAAALPVPPVSPDAATSFSFTLPAGQQISRTLQGAIAISPDGESVVYVSNDRLHLYRISEKQTSPIPGTNGALNPVFSPDGRWLAFWMFGDRNLKKIPLSGGVPVTLSPLPVAPSSLDWQGDTLVYATVGGIVASSASGGSPEVWVPTEPPEIPNNPQILDDGNLVLFSVASSMSLDRWDNADIVIFSRKTGTRKILHHGGSDARYVPTGHLVFLQGNTLFAVPFDLKREEITGSPVRIVEGVLHAVTRMPAVMPSRPGPNAWPFGVGQFDFSRNGTFVYAPAAGDEIRVVLNWFNQIRQRTL
jgi:serine/threonine-protein kinase